MVPSSTMLLAPPRPLPDLTGDFGFLWQLIHLFIPLLPCRREHLQKHADVPTAFSAALHFPGYPPGCGLPPGGYRAATRQLP